MLKRVVATALFISGAACAQACDGRLIDSDRVFASPVCIPTEPQRVVVMDHSFSLGIGLELGLPIVGAPLTGMSDEVLKQAAIDAGVEDIGFIAEPSLEKLVALQPDLVIAFTSDAMLAQVYFPLLSTLAPTIVDKSGDWRGYYSLMGHLSGTEGLDEKVDSAFAEYTDRVETMKTRMPQTTVSILRITTWDFQVYTDAPGAYAPFEVAAEVGLIRSAYETAPAGPTLKRPDWEELEQLDGEVLLYIVGGTNDSDSNGRHEEVLANPLWRRLPSVEAGRAYRVDAGTWMEFSGLPSAHKVLDDIERYVIDAE